MWKGVLIRKQNKKSRLTICTFSDIPWTVLGHFDKYRKKGYHATTLEVSVLHQGLALFCIFATIIIKIGCCIVVLRCSVQVISFSERNIFVQKSFESIKEGLVQYHHGFLSVFKLNN